MEVQLNIRTLKFLQNLVKTSVLVAVGISLTGIAGWIFDISVLRSILPNASPIKFNTALGLGCAAVSIWLLHDDDDLARRKLIGRFLALLIILIGALSLSQYLFRWDPGIDQFFVKNLANSLELLPARMSPVTAISFMLLGVGLLLQKSRLAQYFSISVLLLSLLALIGYLVNPQALYRMPGYGSISLLAASTFFILSFATLATRPNVGIMKLITSDVMAGWALRFLLPVTILLVTFLGWGVEEAERLGLVNPDYESVVLVTTLILIYSPVLYFYARQMNWTEIKFHKSEELFRTSFEFSPVGMCLTGPDGTLQKANQSLADLLDYPKEELIGKHFNQITHPEDCEIGRDALRKMIAGEIPNISFEKRYLRKTGGFIWGHVSITLLRDSSHQPLHFITQILDITARKQMEEQLRESEERFRSLIEQAAEGITLVNEDGYIIEWNQAMERITGVSSADASAQPIWEVQAQFMPSERQSVYSVTQTKEMFQKAFHTGNLPHTGKQVDLHIQTKNGERKIVTQTIFAIQSARGYRFGSVVLDITERKHVEEALRASEEKYRMVVEMAEDVILLTDINGKHLYRNSSYFNSLGFEPGKNIETDGYARVHPDDRPHMQAVLYDLLSTGSAVNEYRVQHKDGHWITRQAKTVTIYDQAHKPEAFLSVIRDITERKRYEEGLRSMNDELEKRVATRTAELYQINTELEHANHIKDEFLANMSHELRTPLNSILGLSETLLEQRRGPLNDYQQKCLQIVEASGHHLLELINDILDLSKIEAGKLDFYPQPVSIEDICRSSLAFIKAQAAKKSITVVYDNKSAVREIFADARRLKQILVNLLTNAVKFTPEHGHVSLQVNTRLEQELIQFSIIDDGVGIASKDLQRLFQPFVQVDGGLNRVHEGTGLGLALVQKLTDLHGGSIEVESEVNKGSRFTINLACSQNGMERVDEIKKLLSSNEPVDKDPVTAAIQSRGTILLAEDNLPNVLTIGEYLESHEYEIVVAHDGSEAIAKAHEINPNLILMDIQMPVMNGLEAIAHLRADDRFASTPIIALTALAMPGDRERCLQAGATEFLSKPVSLKMLVKVVGNLIEQDK